MLKLQNWPKQKIGYLEGWSSIIINTALFGFKLWVGFLDNSIAMQADAWHTFSDSLTSLIVIFGFFLASRPADQEHPFGHGRAEYAAGLIIGALLIGVGINFLHGSIERLINSHSVQYSIIAIFVFGLSVFLKLALGIFSHKLGKLINSSSLKGDAWHHHSDAIASALIVLGALVGSYFSWIDGVLGILISAFIIFSAICILRENLNLLLGLDVPSALKEEIIRLILKNNSGVSDIHHFHLHHYGEHSELTFHIRVKETMRVKYSHELTKGIEKLIKEKYGFEVTIHVEPE